MVATFSAVALPEDGFAPSNPIGNGFTVRRICLIFATLAKRNVKDSNLRGTIS